MNNKSKNFKRNFIIIFALAGIPFFYFLFLSSPGAVNVNLAVKQDEAIYVFSMFGENYVKQTISKGESPTTMPSFELYSDNDSLFVKTDKIIEIYNLIAGNYIIHKYKEPAFEGYVTVNNNNGVHIHEIKNQSGKNIDEQI